LGALTVAAVSLSTSFVIGYAKIPPNAIGLPQPAPAQAAGR